MIDAAFGVLAPLAFAWAVGYAATRPLRDPRLRRTLWAGLAVRLLGGGLYLALHEAMYGGGDYSLYLSEAFWALGDAGNGAHRSLFALHANNWSGTSATSVVTWWAAAVVGQSPVGLFMVFATLNFAGVACFAAAFRRAFSEIDPLSYTRWIMFFPSLWFWSSALGKDALIMVGLGVAVVGFVGRTRRQWVLVAIGLAVVFAIRPSYAVVAASALALGGLVGRNRRGTELQWVVSAAVIATGAYFAFPLLNSALGFEVTDLAAAAQRIDDRAQASAYGGSSFEAADDPVTAVITTLFRPFPWEARGALMLAASAEMLLLWGLVLRRRRAAARFVRDYWRTEPVVLSGAFVVALALLVGLAVGNFGTIVRQRVHLYPFLFVIVAAYAYRGVPRRAALRRRSRAPRRLSVPA